jgi:hypothetical protein
MEAASYPLRIPKNILELALFRTKEEHIDKSTALRQLLYMGAQDYVLGLYKKGRISLSRAAELLEVSTFDVLRLAQEKGIQIGATGMQQEKSRDAAAELTL